MSERKQMRRGGEPVAPIRLSHFVEILMTTRARFEKWAESSGWNIDRTDEGDYRTMSTDAAWGGWNACAVEAENVFSRECIEWARICEYQKRHGCKVGAQECANLIRGWRANNETPNMRIAIDRARKGTT